jgi:integrase
VARKPFYLVLRLDRLIAGRPAYYCRFRDVEGNLLPWVSTGETARTRAELWALGRLGENRERRETITFEAFVAGFWSPEGAFAQGRAAHGFSLSKGYLEIAEGYTRNHFEPAWGSHRLRDLTPGRIDAWIVRLRREGTLAAASVNKLLQTLRTILGQAVAEGYLTENPAAFVKPVRAERTPRGILTPAEVALLLSSPRPWADYKHYALNLFALTTGARMGEVRGLLVENVKADHVAIRTSWEQGHGLKPLKYNSVWDEPICDRVAEALSKVIAEYRPSSLVFYGAEPDTPMSKSCIEGHLYRALEAVGIPEVERRKRGITFHSHRHFLNTLLRSRGVPGSKIRQITGHRTPQMSDWYTHYRADDFREVVAAQEGLFKHHRRLGGPPARGRSKAR